MNWPFKVDLKKKTQKSTNSLGTAVGSPKDVERQRAVEGGVLAGPEARNGDQDGRPRFRSEAVRGASAAWRRGRRQLFGNLHWAYSLPDRAAGAGSCVSTALRRGGGGLSFFFQEDAGAVGLGAVSFGKFRLWEGLFLPRKQKSTYSRSKRVVECSWGDLTSLFTRSHAPKHVFLSSRGSAPTPPLISLALNL